MLGKCQNYKNTEILHNINVASWENLSAFQKQRVLLIM